MFLNVLAYLNDEEELEFYEQARRVVKENGYLIVTHYNMLFDMFSLNKYTVKFFSGFLVSEQYREGIDGLITRFNIPKVIETYNIRENPLSYRYKLKGFGFEEIQQEFSNLHEAPPCLLGSEKIDKTFPDTLSFSEEERWKLFFTCSTFGSTSVRITT